MAANLKTVRFTITKTNDTGFQAAEVPDQWFNISKYAKLAPAIPPVGSRVEATVDPPGFVMAVEPVKENGVGMMVTPTIQPQLPDQTALRLAVLDIAARFLATRPDAKSTDVLKVAEIWEGWVER